MVKKFNLLVVILFSCCVAQANWMSEEERQALFDRVQSHFLVKSEETQFVPLNNLCRHRGLELGNLDIRSVRLEEGDEKNNLVISYSNAPGSFSFIHVSDEVTPIRPSLRTLVDFKKIVTDVNNGADLYVTCGGTGFVSGLFTEMSDSFQTAYIGATGLKWSSRFQEKYSLEDAKIKCESIGARVPTAEDVRLLLNETLHAQGYNRAVNKPIDRDLLDLDQSADNFYTSTYTSAYYNYLSFADDKKTKDCFWQTGGMTYHAGQFNCVGPYSHSIGKLGPVVVNPEEAMSVICVKD